jgi:type II secretory pathway component GspD/PulD (secretin)
VLGSTDLTLPADPPLDSAARLFLGNLDAGNGNFDAVIEALKGVGEVRILSEPSIILTSLQADPTRAPLPPASAISTAPSTAPSKSGNDPAWASGSARLANATQIPYAITQYVGNNSAEVTLYRDVGVTLDVVAQSVRDNLIFLDTRATVSDVNGFICLAVDRDGNPQTVPVIDSRMIQNRLVIPDRSIFIAGLMKATREVERKSGIPWLSELPGLRWFLANNSRQTVESELVFLLRPEIMSPYRAAGVGLAQEGVR